MRFCYFSNLTIQYFLVFRYFLLHLWANSFLSSVISHILSFQCIAEVMLAFDQIDWVLYVCHTYFLIFTELFVFLLCFSTFVLLDILYLSKYFLKFDFFLLEKEYSASLIFIFLSSFLQNHWLANLWQYKNSVVLHLARPQRMFLTSSLHWSLLHVQTPLGRKNSRIMMSSKTILATSNAFMGLLDRYTSHLKISAR